MKSQTNKNITNLSMNEYSANTHKLMVIVYGMLFAAWLFVQVGK